MGEIINFEPYRQARQAQHNAEATTAMKALVEQLCEYDFWRLGHCEDHEYGPEEPEYYWWRAKAEEIYAMYPAARERGRAFNEERGVEEAQYVEGQ